jgi:hypothetical protein
MLKKDTVKQVRSIAAQLGYVPNPMARALSTGRQGNIAIVIPDLTNRFFRRSFAPRNQRQMPPDSAYSWETPTRMPGESSAWSTSW